MPALRAVPVTLTAAERMILKKKARGAKTAHRDRQRAQIVLLAARRWPTAAIARCPGVTQDMVRKWRAGLPPPAWAGWPMRPRLGGRSGSAALDRPRSSGLPCH